METPPNERLEFASSAFEIPPSLIVTAPVVTEKLSVENEAIPQIRDAIRRGADIGVS